MFSPDLLEKNYLSFQVFCWEQNRWKSLGCKVWCIWWRKWHKPVKMKYIFLSDSCWMWPCITMEKHHSSLIDTCGTFSLKISCSSHSCWENKSALSVWLQFKNTRWVIPQWSHRIHSITFLPWSSTFGLGCGDSFLSIYCLLLGTWS